MSRSNDEWLPFYQNSHPPTTMQSWSDATDTVVTTTNTTISNQLSRVTRPTNNRRRSRASRKTPTTLLNTDTTNFRAMVQRFTGGGDATANDSSVVTATHRSSLNAFNTNINGTSSSLPLGGLFSNEDYNVQFRQPHSQPYFTTAEDDGGSSTAHDGEDQQLGYRQRGFYSW